MIRTQEEHRKDNTHIIDIAKEFSQLPRGRYHSDSPDCAEALMIMIRDTLCYDEWVELRFNDLPIAGVGSNFLDHLAKLVVANDYSNRVAVVSDNDWVVSRYNKYFDIYSKGVFY